MQSQVLPSVLRVGRKAFAVSWLWSKVFHRVWVDILNHAKEIIFYFSFAQWFHLLFGFCLFVCFKSQEWIFSGKVVFFVAVNDFFFFNLLVC